MEYMVNSLSLSTSISVVTYNIGLLDVMDGYIIAVVDIDIGNCSLDNLAQRDTIFSWVIVSNTLDGHISICNCNSTCVVCWSSL